MYGRGYYSMYIIAFTPETAVKFIGIGLAIIGAILLLYGIKHLIFYLLNRWHM